MDLCSKQRRTATVEEPSIDLVNAMHMDEILQSAKCNSTVSHVHREPFRHTRHPRNTYYRISSATCSVPGSHTEEDLNQNSKSRRHSISDFLWTKAKRLSRRIRRHMLNSVYLFHEDAYGVSWTTAHNLITHDDELDKPRTSSTTVYPDVSVHSPILHRRTRLYELDKPAREQIIPVQYKKFRSVNVDRNCSSMFDDTLNQLSPTILRNIEHELNKRHRLSTQSEAAYKNVPTGGVNQSADFHYPSSCESCEDKPTPGRHTGSNQVSASVSSKGSQEYGLSTRHFTEKPINVKQLKKDWAVPPNAYLQNGKQIPASSPNTTQHISFLHPSLSDDGIFRLEGKSSSCTNLTSTDSFDAARLNLVEQDSDIGQLERLLPRLQVRAEQQSTNRPPLRASRSARKSTLPVQVN